MSKKIKAQPKSKSQRAEDGRLLPQNIFPVGERVEEDKNIYIAQPVYNEIHKFTQNKVTNESGGMLIGRVIEEFDKTNILINGFVEAKYSEGTPTTLKFTHETWEYVHKEIERKYPGQKIVGWIHTHPDFGIFLSEYDKFIQNNFFKEEYQIAYVVDPIQDVEGFYFWINGKIERCKGFYLFDKTGVPISLREDTSANDRQKRPSEAFSFHDMLTAALTVIAIILLLVNISQGSRISNIEKRQTTQGNSTSQNLQYIQQQIDFLNRQISEMYSSLNSGSNDGESSEEAESSSQEMSEDTESADELSSGDEGSVLEDEGSVLENEGSVLGDESFVPSDDGSAFGAESQIGGEQSEALVSASEEMSVSGGRESEESHNE